MGKAQFAKRARNGTGNKEPMKQAHKSRTIQAAAAMLIASITTLSLHYTGSVVLGAPALGAAWSAVVSGAVMIFFRLITREPIGTLREPVGTDTMTDEEGKP